PNFFRTLGVQPELGRDFAETDEPETSVIISHALWQRQFGGTANVIGQRIELGLPRDSSVDKYEIVGVLPPETNFPARTDLFTAETIKRSEGDRGGSHNWRTIGRLRAGVTVAQAQSEIDTITQRQAEQYPDTNKGWEVQVEPFRDYLFGSSRTALPYLF